MSNKRTIARPYAKAMFATMNNEDSSKAKALIPLLQILAIAVKEPKMDQAIKNPSLTQDQIVDCLIHVCTDVDANHVKVFGKKRLHKWLAYLHDANRLDCLPDIYDVVS